MYIYIAETTVLIFSYLRRSTFKIIKSETNSTFLVFNIIRYNHYTLYPESASQKKKFRLLIIVLLVF